MKKWLCVLMAFLCLLLCGCSGGIMVTGSYDHADRYSVGGFIYDAASVRSVEIHWISGSVTLTESDAARLTVAEEESGLSADQQMRWLLEGDTLRIQFCQSGYKGIFKQKKALNMQLPQGVDLKVNGTSADVKLGDHTLQEMALDTVSGGITAGNLRAEELRVNTVSGNIRAGLVDLRDEMKIDSVSGDITVEAVKAREVEINSISGNVSLALYQCGGADIDTISGDVALYAPHDQGVRVEYSTASGKVNGQKSKSGSQTLGSGATDCKAEISTVSGDITLGEK